MRSGRVRSMQNKQITCAPLHQPGALLLGDAFNMRHPLTGGGGWVGCQSGKTPLLRILHPSCQLPWWHQSGWQWHGG